MNPTNDFTLESESESLSHILDSEYTYYTLNRFFELLALMQRYLLIIKIPESFDFAFCKHIDNY